jgi:hypothetical protein
VPSDWHLYRDTQRSSSGRFRVRSGTSNSENVSSPKLHFEFGGNAVVLAYLYGGGLPSEAQKLGLQYFLELILKGYRESGSRLQLTEIDFPEPPDLIR